jgi:putative DNA primase/helicase
MKSLLNIGITINPRGAAEQRVPCPRCAKNKRDDALGVNIETGKFHCFRCGWKSSDESSAVITTVRRIDDPSVAERKRERLRQTWKETVSLNHADAWPVRSYLESRALGEILKAPPAVLRAHRGLAYWDKYSSRVVGRFPAMVALFHGASGQPATLHVTWLRADGCAKAAVGDPKKIIGVPVRGATKGGAIRLFEPRARILGLCEGIESALSMHLLQKLPVWSTYCAENLAAAHLPAGLLELHIGIDVDANGKGEQVAQSLAKRVRRWSPRTKVFIVTPEVEGTGDLNDELRRRKHGRG